MKLSGPQSERDRLWGPKQIALRGELTGQREDQADVVKLRNENRALRDQIQRAMKELHFYQTKYPSAYQSDHRDDDVDPSLWAAKPEVMVPLLEAYDNRIFELEDTIRQQTSKLESFREKIETLVQENDELRSRLLDDLHGGSRLGPSGPLNAELLAELSEKVSLLMEENAVLVDQKVKLTQELESQADLLDSQKQQLVSLSNTAGELSKECHRLAHLVAATEKERDEAVHQAVSVSEALGKAEQEIDNLADQRNLDVQQAADAKGTIADLQRQVKLMSSRYNEDASTTVSKMKFAEDTVRSLRGELMLKSRELEQAAEAMRKLRAEYKSTRQDAEGMLQVMTGMEKQLNEYAAREEQVAKMSAEAREKLEEAVMVREQCAVREEQARREVERLLAERKTAALAKQDEVAAAVETARRGLQEQQRSMEKEIDALIHKNAQLMYESEKALRESHAAKDLYNRSHDLYQQHTKQCDDEVQRLQGHLLEVVGAREKAEAALRDMQEQNKELRALVDKYRGLMDQHRAQVAALARSSDGDLLQLKAAAADQLRELGEKGRAVAKLQKELADLRQQQAAQHDSDRGKYVFDSQQHLHKVQDYEAMINSLQKELGAGEVRAQEQLEQLREKYANVQQLMETRRQAEAEKNRQLIVKLKAMEVRAYEAEEERSAAAQAAQQLEAKLQQLLVDQASSEATIRDLSQQLLSHQHAKEQGVYAALSAVM